MPGAVSRIDAAGPAPTSGPQIRLVDPLRIELCGLGCVRLGADWTYADLCAPFWRLYLHDADGASLVVARRGWALPAGRAALIPPWLRFATRPGCGVRQTFLHFTTAGLAEPVVRRLFPAPIDLGPDAGLTAGLAALGDAIAADGGPTRPAHLLSAKGLAALALARASDRLAPADAALLLGELRSMSPARALAAAIAADPGADWSTATLARRLGCSRDQAIRAFRRDLGITPARYVGERRLASAAAALLAGGAGIEEIALAYGFANRFSFTRGFARRFGIGPAAFRRRG